LAGAATAATAAAPGTLLAALLLLLLLRPLLRSAVRTRRFSLARKLLLELLQLLLHELARH
jgi:hypothetical protein